jgi:dnd system-associated protein 4
MDTQELKESDRVSIENVVHQYYKELTDKSSQDPEGAPFLLMKDVFMWAVAIGIRNGTRQPLSRPTSQIFRWDQFSQDSDVPALKAVAVAETGDVEILLDPPAILRIAEEYANAGIRELRTELSEREGRPLWNLLSLARS